MTVKELIKVLQDNFDPDEAVSVGKCVYDYDEGTEEWWIDDPCIIRNKAPAGGCILGYNDFTYLEKDRLELVAK